MVTITYYPDNNQTITPDGYSLAWKTYLTDPSNLGMSCPDNFPKPITCTSTIGNINNIVIKEYDLVVETL
jgi:hypothetical protein